MSVAQLISQQKNFLQKYISQSTLFPNRAQKEHVLLLCWARFSAVGTSWCSFGGLREPRDLQIKMLWLPLFSFAALIPSGGLLSRNGKRRHLVLFTALVEMPGVLHLSRCCWLWACCKFLYYAEILLPISLFSPGDDPFVYLCGGLCLLICAYWTIPECLGWSQLDHGWYSCWCVIELDLLIFY